MTPMMLKILLDTSMARTPPAAPDHDYLEARSQLRTLGLFDRDGYVSPLGQAWLDHAIATPMPTVRYWFDHKGRPGT